MAATGEAFGRASSWADLRRNSAGSGRRISVGRRGSSISTGGGMSPIGVSRNMPIQERVSEDIREALRHPAVVNSLVDAAEESEKLGSRDSSDAGVEGESEDEEKPGAWAATMSGLLGFWMWFKKPVGFFVTIYMLNIVAWGGMLFLLLCNAAPAMCKPTCNAINSPRRIWIEIDSQILNGLFCVTGFGLAPWRFRDLYYLLKWRCYGKQSGYLKLQEINQNWYRPGPAASGSPEAVGSSTDTAATDDIDTATGKRAPPTKSWKLDYVIWLYVLNTFFQCCLCGFMWGMNRYQRPSWSTGFFVALACIVAMMAGGQVWWETRKVKRIEGDKKEEEKKEEKAKS
ncbi:hypothetical protein BDD12DRAFT_918737 [Trichophaea hybrida]|nr:hypothetical protein BDD12DRAFT_918737 [Trichophaea hybrida]